MFENIKAIIFDVDGTIVDSREIWEKVNIDFFESFGMKISEETMKKLLSLSFDDGAEYCVRELNTPYTVEEIKNFWNKKGIEYYQKYVFLKDGVKEFLQFIKNNNLKLGVATNNSRLVVESLFQKEGILDKFDFICTSSDVVVRKPDPEMFVSVAKKLNINASNCLVFEDSRENIEGAKLVGMKVCAVVDCSKLDKIQYKTDYQICSFRELEI